MLRRLIVLVFVVASLTGVLAVLSTATANAAPRAENCARDSMFLGFPTWYKYLEPEFINGECKLTALDPDNDGNTTAADMGKAIGKVILAVIEIMLRVAALVAIGFIIYGGVLYISSQGEPDKTKQALATVTNALIGLVVAVMATILVTFVGGRFG